MLSPTLGLFFRVTLIVATIELQDCTPGLCVTTASIETIALYHSQLLLSCDRDFETWSCSSIAAQTIMLDCQRSFLNNFRCFVASCCMYSLASQALSTLSCCQCFSDAGNSLLLIVGTIIAAYACMCSAKSL